MNGEDFIDCPLCGNRNEPDRTDCKVCGSSFREIPEKELTILNALQQISGVGKTRAKKIVESGFDDIKKLEDADLDSFLSVEGIGENTAMDIYSALEDSKKSDGSLYLCGDCGAFVGANSDRCPECGVMMVEEEEDEEEEFMGSVIEDDMDEEEGDSLYLCSNCGSFISSEADECPYCGSGLEVEDEEEIEGEHPVVDEVEEESEDGLFLCTNCGSFVGSDAKECTVCGFFFDDGSEQELVEDDDLEDILGEEIFDEESPETDVDKIVTEDFNRLLQEETDEDLASEEKMWFDDDELEIEESDLEELDREIEMALEREYGISAKTIQALSLGGDLNLCGNCGGINEADAEKCSICGYVFSEGTIEVEEKAEWDLEKTTETMGRALGLSEIPDGELDEVEKDTEVGLCSVCGAFKTQDSERCPICGSLVAEAPELELEETPYDDRVEERKSEGIFICDACGSFVEREQDRCSLCGSNLEYARRSVAEETIEEESEPQPNILDGIFEKGLDTDSDEVSTCDNCGALIPKGSVECYICSTPVEEEPIEVPVKEEITVEEPILEEDVISEESFDEDPFEEEIPIDEPTLKEEEMLYGFDEEQGSEVLDEDSIESEVTDDELVELLKNVELSTLEEPTVEVEEVHREDDFDAGAMLEEINQTVKDKVDFHTGEEQVYEEDWERCPSCDSFMSADSLECGICGHSTGTEQIVDEDTSWIEEIMGEDMEERLPSTKDESITAPGGIFGSFVSRVSEYEVPASSLSLFAIGGVFLYSYGSGGGAPTALGIALLVILGFFLFLGVATILNWKEILFQESYLGFSGYIIALISASFVPLNHYLFMLSVPLVVYAGLIAFSIGLIWMMDFQIDEKLRQYLMWFVGIAMLLIISSLIIYSNASSFSDMGYPTAMSIGFGSLMMIGSTVAWYKEANSETDILKNIEVGHRHLISGDYEDALVAYERAIQKGTRSAKSLQDESDMDYPIYSKGLALCSMGNYDEAVDTFKKLLEVAPDSVATWNNLGTAYSRMGKQEMAIKCLRRALEIDKNYEVSWNNLGNALFRKGRYSDALDCYDKALQINSSYRDATVNKTQCLVKLGSGM